MTAESIDRAIPGWGKPRSKTVHWYDPMITAAAGRPLSGADFLRSIRDGVIPPPPIAAGVAYTSIDINVSYLRPVTTDSGLLRATGLVTKPGRRVAHATAEIVDQAGKLVATASSSCLVMEPRPA